MVLDLVDEQGAKLPLGLLTTDETSTATDVVCDPTLLSTDSLGSLAQACLGPLLLLASFAGSLVLGWRLRRRRDPSNMLLE